MDFKVDSGSRNNAETSGWMERFDQEANRSRGHPLRMERGHRLALEWIGKVMQKRREARAPGTVFLETALMIKTRF